MNAVEDNTARFVRMFETAEFTSQQGRQDAEKARDYYDGRQLTSAQLKALSRRKQPPVIENLIRPKIDYLCGLERQTRTDPVCYPRTLDDDDAAQVGTDVLRYVADDQKLDIKRSAVFADMLVEGYGAVEIGVRQKRDVIDPTIERIAWDRLFFDPHSCAHDFSDAMYMGFITWMDRDEADARWENAQAIIAEAFDRGASASDTYSDKPKSSPWTDRERNRVRIVTMYHRKGEVWHRVVFTQGGELEPDAESPYLDEDGAPECALIMASAYVDRDNDRYGIVRDLIPLQDEVNKRRSKFLHLVNTRQVRVGRAFEGDEERIRKEAARPDGVFTADKDELEFVGTGDLSTGHFTLLGEAKQAIQGLGPNAHMQGKQEGTQSGRAILAMQQGGMTEMAPLLDALRDFNMRCFRAIWNRVRQFWKAERWVRITDDEKAVRFAGVNVSQASIAMQKVKDALESRQIDQATAQRFAQDIMMDPAMRQPANVLSEIDVDIQIDEVQNTPTLHAEQFEQLAQAAQSGIIKVPPRLLIRASNFRNKQELLDELDKEEKGQQQAGQQQQEMQAQAIQIEMRDKAASAAKKEADAVLAGERALTEQSDRELDAARVQIDAFQAGTSIAA